MIGQLEVWGSSCGWKWAKLRLIWMELWRVSMFIFYFCCRFVYRYWCKSLQHKCQPFSGYVCQTYLFWKGTASLRTKVYVCLRQLLHNLVVTITLWDSATPDDANIPRESFSHHSRLVAKFPRGSVALFGQQDLRRIYLPLKIQWGSTRFIGGQGLPCTIVECGGWVGRWAGCFCQRQGDVEVTHECLCG